MEGPRGLVWMEAGESQLRLAQDLWERHRMGRNGLMFRNTGRRLPMAACLHGFAFTLLLLIHPLSVVCSFIFDNRVSCNPGWPLAHDIAKASLELWLSSCFPSVGIIGAYHHA